MNNEVVRKGKVSSVNAATREVRVYFPEDDYMSGWLKVLKSSPFIPSKDSEQRTEATSGGSGDASFASHPHKITIAPWPPSIDDIVICVYETGFNGDGYVLGAL